MSDSDDHLPTASSTNSSDTSYPSNWEEMEVVSKGSASRWRTASNVDFDKDWQRRSLACEIKTENSRYWVFTSLRLCFVFCGKILLRLGRCVCFCCHIILFLRIKCGRRFPLVSAQIANNFLSKNCNENKREVAHTRWRLKL